MVETKVNQGLLESLNQMNIIDNGGFEIWQRGSGPFVGPSWCADRWDVQGVTLTVTKETAVANVYVGSSSLKLVNASSGGYIRQYIENYLSYRGKTISVSLWVKCQIASGWKMRLADGTQSVDSEFNQLAYQDPGPDLWERMTVTMDVATTATVLYLQFHNAGAGASTVYVDAVMVVVGNKPQEFVPTPPAYNLLRCQRYYQTGNATITAHGADGSSWYQFGYTQIIPSMASSPTITNSAWVVTEVGSGTNVQASYSKNPTMYGSKNRLHTEVYKTKGGSLPVYMDTAWITEVT